MPLSIRVFEKPELTPVIKLATFALIVPQIGSDFPLASSGNTKISFFSFFIVYYSLNFKEISPFLPLTVKILLSRAHDVPSGILILFLAILDIN